MAFFPKLFRPQPPEEEEEKAPMAKEATPPAPEAAAPLPPTASNAPVAEPPPSVPVDEVLPASTVAAPVNARPAIVTGHSRRLERALQAALPREKPATGDFVLLLEDVLPRVPTSGLRPGRHRPELELHFDRADLWGGIAKGRPVVKLSFLAEKFPGIFLPPRASGQDVVILLPLQKLVSQLGEPPRKPELPAGEMLVGDIMAPSLPPSLQPLSMRERFGIPPRLAPLPVSDPAEIYVSLADAAAGRIPPPPTPLPPGAVSPAVAHLATPEPAAEEPAAHELHTALEEWRVLTKARREPPPAPAATEPAEPLPLAPPPPVVAEFTESPAAAGEDFTPAESLVSGAPDAEAAAFWPEPPPLVEPALGGSEELAPPVAVLKSEALSSGTEMPPVVGSYLEAEPSAPAKLPAEAIAVPAEPQAGALPAAPAAEETLAIAQDLEAATVAGEPHVEVGEEVAFAAATPAPPAAAEPIAPEEFVLETTEPLDTLTALAEPLLVEASVAEPSPVEDAPSLNEPLVAATASPEPSPAAPPSAGTPLAGPAAIALAFEPVEVITPTAPAEAPSPAEIALALEPVEAVAAEAEAAPPAPTVQAEASAPPPAEVLAEIAAEPLPEPIGLLAEEADEILAPEPVTARAGAAETAPEPTPTAGAVELFAPGNIYAKLPQLFVPVRPPIIQPVQPEEFHTPLELHPIESAAEEHPASAAALAETRSPVRVTAARALVRPPVLNPVLTAAAPAPTLSAPPAASPVPAPAALPANAPSPAAEPVAISLPPPVFHLPPVLPIPAAGPSPGEHTAAPTPPPLFGGIGLPPAPGAAATPTPAPRRPPLPPTLSKPGPPKPTVPSASAPAVEAPRANSAGIPMPSLWGGTPAAAAPVSVVNAGLVRTLARQAIFMVDEPLPLARVAELIAGLPGIYGCRVVDGEVAESGDLPEELDAEVMREMAAAVLGLQAGAENTFPLEGTDRAITFFARRGASLCVVHESTGFRPGVRERLSALADTLA